MTVLSTEAEQVAALRAGDETAFSQLVERHHPALVRLAMAYVGERTVAEEVAQETWLAVLRGLQRFEGRSSLKTWLYTILVNRAKTRGQRENRSIPFSDLGEAEADEPAVEAGRFISANDSAQWAGHWKTHPAAWDDLPEARVLGREIGAVLQRAIDALPPNQQQVIRLRDVDGFSSEEVCNILEITETNQRVLLHRARSKVRRALEAYLAVDSHA